MYDDLIKRLRNRRICVQQLGTLNDYPLLGEAAEAIEELSRDYEKLAEDFNCAVELLHKRSEPRWIPVTERLPEKDGDYLVWFYDAACCKVCEFNKHTAKERYVWWFAGVDRTRFVTHWLPLPQPPEEE